MGKHRNDNVASIAMCIRFAAIEIFLTGTR